MNTVVNFELSKLLKEKGFNEPCPVVVINKNEYHLISGTEDTILNGMVFFTSKNKRLPDHICSAPTIAEVVMWLYEKHGIWISVEATDDFTMFCFRVRKKEISRLSFNYNTPIEAYEEAIKYTLNNLI